MLTEVPGKGDGFPDDERHAGHLVIKHVQVSHYVLRNVLLPTKFCCCVDWIKEDVLNLYSMGKPLFIVNILRKFSTSNILAVGFRRLE